MSYTVPEMFRNISPSDWKDEIADISNWEFERIDKAHPSPTCVFSVRIKLRLPGYDKVQDLHHVDVVDMNQGVFATQSNPEAAYINYMRSQFRINVLLKAHAAIQKYRQRMAANLAPQLLTVAQRDQVRINGIEDPFLRRKAVEMANIKHDMRNKGFIGKGAKYSHLDYFNKV
jgi:hypothetical protein